MTILEMIENSNLYVTSNNFHVPFDVIKRAFEYYKKTKDPTIYLFAICENDIEILLHKKYDKKRIRGEWFNLNQRQINVIIKKYNFKIIT